MCFFEKFRPPQKNLSTRLFIPFLKYQGIEILLNILLQTFSNLIVRRITKEGEFCNRYLDSGCVNSFIPIAPFFLPLKTSENLTVRFSDIFRV